MIKSYLQLTKPGIIFGNLVTVAAGFLLASRGNINYSLFIVTLLGLSLVVASGCVFNNYIDRDIDALMERTKDRVLVRGLIASRNALYFGAFLGVLGFLILANYTNRLTLLVALAGLIVYLVFYTLFAKRNSIYGTLIGSIAGAVPPVVGYLAVTNKIDAGAVLLFFILAIWQMPHSYAIAIYRLQDYLAAKIPVLPAKRGVRETKSHIIFWIILFIIAVHQLHYYHYAGAIYLVVMLLLSLAWLGYAVNGLREKNDSLWSRNMFLLSLVIIIAFSILISVDATK